MTLVERLEAHLAAASPYRLAKRIDLPSMLTDETTLLIGEAIAAINELDCELAHAYWASCGCLAGGIGHEEGGPECPLRERKCLVCGAAAVDGYAHLKARKLDPAHAQRLSETSWQSLIGDVKK